MKKIIAPLMVASLVVFASCSKVIEQIFPGLDARVPDIQLTIPALPIVPPNEILLGMYSAHFNLDSIIKANTGGVFGIGVVSSIKIKEVTVSLSNADNLSNLSNFEYARVAITSNTATEAAGAVTLNFPDANTSSVTVTPDDSPELINYLKGTELNYTIYGKARRPTLKPLNMTVSITVRVK
jgi:hypothetical protein